MSNFTIQNFLTVGLKYPVNELIPPGERQLELGPGNQPMQDCDHIGKLYWDADTMDLPFVDECYDTVWASHFLEHIKDPVKMLQEVQRVLKPGGTLNVVVPHFSAEIAYQDLDHKKFFSESTWRILMDNKWYEGDMIRWQLSLNFNMIMAHTQRNTCVFTQFIKDKNL